jgi:subtilase family serine protease
MPGVLMALVVICAAPQPALAGGGRGGAGKRSRVGSVPVLPAGTQPLAVTPPSQMLRVTVALRPRSAAALARYAQAVSDPNSPLFHRFLTPARFAARFAPTSAQAAEVADVLRREGLDPGTRSANGLAISVAAPVGAIERAFGTSLAEVRLPDGRSATVNSTAPTLNASVAGLVQSVVGLSGLARPAPVALKRLRAASASVRRMFVASRPPGRMPQVVTGGPQACAAARSATGPQTAYTSDQIASAYRFSGLYRRGDKGQGVTVALYELEPNAPSDIAAYQQCYGTHTSISYVRVDGGATGSPAGSGEAALDIEQLIGLAPRARLLVYQAPNSNSDSPGSGPYDLDSAIVSQDRASVVSTSWGVCEPLEGRTDGQAENVLFQEAAIQGQTLVAASGDSGSEACYGPLPSVPDPQLAVEDPASQPFVTGVGGTTLNRLGPPPGETVWNNGGGLGGLLGIQPGAGGGGVSALWRMPVYQRRAPSSLRVRQADSSSTPCHAGSGSCREVPDVSADADPFTGYLIYYNGSGSTIGAQRGWQGIGGTSGSAPLWAALAALADAARSCHGARLGFMNPVLYRLAGARQPAYFNDVTSGNNDYTGTSSGRYPAGGGYDMATGLGTPKAAALADAMCRRGLRFRGPRNQRSVVGHRVNLRLHVSDARGAGLRVRAHHLPPGLHLRSGGHRITGRPRRRGAFQVSLTARDRDGGLRTVHFRWTVRR